MNSPLSQTRDRLAAMTLEQRRAHALSSTDEDVLHALAYDANPDIQAIVAENVHTPDLALMHLATERRAHAGVAKHRNTPSSALRELLRYGEVADLVAANPNATPELQNYILKRFLFGPSPRVVRGLASNPSLTPKVAQSIVASSSDQVACSRARHRLNMPQYLDVLQEAYRTREIGSPEEAQAAVQAVLDNANAETLEAMARDPNMTEDVLVFLATDARPFHGNVRAAAINNNNTPMDVLLDMLRAGDMLHVLVRCPRLSPDVLVAHLADDAYVMLHAVVACRLDASPEVIGRYAVHADPIVRRSVASNPSASAEWLTVLSEDMDVYVRVGVAGNPNTPADVILTLSSDESAYVATMALGHASYVKPEAQVPA